MTDYYRTNAEIRGVIREWLTESDDSDTKALRHTALVWIEELEAELKAIAETKHDAKRWKVVERMAMAVVDYGDIKSYWRFEIRVNGPTFAETVDAAMEENHAPTQQTDGRSRKWLT